MAKVFVKVRVITNKISLTDIEVFEKQYHNVEIKKSSAFHDRFIIIDEEMLYHSGASFKDLGKKCFAINKIESTKILDDLLNQIKETILH